MNITILQLLLAITFVFGVLKFLTMTKVFETGIVGILTVLFGDKSTNKAYGYMYMFIMFVRHFNMLFFYFSLIFQAWYWLFRHV
jgi:hypothetical protein